MLEIYLFLVVSVMLTHIVQSHTSKNRQEIMELAGGADVYYFAMYFTAIVCGVLLPFGIIFILNRAKKEKELIAKVKERMNES